MRNPSAAFSSSSSPSSSPSPPTSPPPPTLLPSAFISSSSFSAATMPSQPQALSWTGRPHIKGGSESVQMALLTAASVGLQFCWGAEMTYAAPYLLSLGLSKSRLSLVWIAGPLSGLIMQPVIGVVSDRSCSRYGRRRPFMVAGSVLVAICLVVLGWTREIVALVVSDQEMIKSLTIWLAVLDIFVLDFVINIAQTTCQAIVVDTLPVAKQQLGAAWASRMMGVGQILVYGICALDLDAIFGGFLGDTQLKKVCLIAALGMAVAQGITCWAVTERVLVPEDEFAGKRLDMVSIVKQIYTTTRNVPNRIQAICWVQFWSWIGWFVVGFFGSTWVGEIYLRYDAPQSREGTNPVDEVGRHGSMSFVVYSIVSFTSAIVLPWLVRSPDEDDRPSYTARPPQLLQPMLRKVRWRKPSLLTAWAITNVMFFAVMIWAPLVQSVRFATLLIGLVAIPRAVAAWAPSAFLGVEVNKMSGSALPTSNRRASIDSIEMDGNSTPKVLHLRHESTASTASASTGELSGIYLGILNIYTTLPQFVGTGISWVVFSILEPGKSPELAPDTDPKELHSTDGLSGIGVCLSIGAMCALAAAWATRRLRSKGD